ncbi:MAG: hypothetical protein WCK05_14565 [Planctomycetota bacterium]
MPPKKTDRKKTAEVAPAAPSNTGPALAELCEAVRNQLVEIFAKVEALDFAQARDRLVAKCREFRQGVAGAEPGHEFDDTLPIQWETWWLASRLGFDTGPVSVARGRQSMEDFARRYGPTPPDGPASKAPLWIPRATVYLPAGGRELMLPIAFCDDRGGSLVGVSHPPLGDENRRKVSARFDKWIEAAGNCLPCDFKPDVHPDDADYWQALQNHAAELILLWHGPKPDPAAAVKDATPATPAATPKKHPGRKRTALPQLLQKLRIANRWSEDNGRRTVKEFCADQGITEKYFKACQTASKRETERQLSIAGLRSNDDTGRTVAQFCTDHRITESYLEECMKTQRSNTE